jgi:hypothetical protein
VSIAAFQRMQRFTEPGSAGIVTDTLFINCYWPKLDRPTRIFADGSRGIRVLGTTPRNVWFPDDIVFEPWYPDALYPAELAVKAMNPRRSGLVNLTEEEAQVWWDAYNEAVKSFPPTHTVIDTPRHVNFLRDGDYVAELTSRESKDIAEGRTDPATLQKQFVHINTRAAR